MEMVLFQRLLPVLRRTRLPYLQGWGGPLTHPHFFSLVALARETGCRVAATTNGVLLDECGCQRMVREGPDILAFSLAGFGAGNDQVRRGTHIWPRSIPSGFVGVNDGNHQAPQPSLSPSPSPG